jgi:trans-2,3-dihydro-3-hydroxyanthranilate isomerase
VANVGQQVVIRQGVEMGRPSEIFVRADRNNDQVTNVRVGGYAVEVLRGIVTL